MREAYEEELKALDKELTRELSSSETASVLTKRGVALYYLNRVEDGLDSIDRALNVAPDDFPEMFLIWYNKGAILGGVGRDEEAIAVYDRAIREHAKAAAWNHQDYELFDETITENPEAAILSNRAYALGALGEYEAALASVNKALEIDANFVPALYTKNGSLLGLQRYEEALSTTSKVVLLTPDEALAWVYHSFNLHALNQEEDALIAYEKAISIAPNSAGIWYTRGESMRILGRTEEAIVAYEKAQSLSPGDESIAKAILELKSELGGDRSPTAPNKRGLLTRGKTHTNA